MNFFTPRKMFFTPPHVFFAFACSLLIAANAGAQAEDPAAEVREPALKPEASPEMQAVIDPNGQTLETRILPPPGFVRVPVSKGSFGEFLRQLPMKPQGSPVLYHNGQPKPYQQGAVAVIDYDVGKRDLQQCADAVIRLYAEWQWASGQKNAISFQIGNRKDVPWRRWAQGERLSVQDWSWSRRAKANHSYSAFRKYLDFIYTYAYTRTLALELKPVPFEQMEPGDVFIVGGSPGHAVTVLDVVHTPETGERRFIAAQSYMPAQSIHVISNLYHLDDPWYRLDAAASQVKFPEWTFQTSQLKRFKKTR